MDNLVVFLVWSLVIFGFANGLAVSKLLAPFRLWLRYSKYEILDSGKAAWTVRKNKLQNFIADLVHCPMCLGFWAGGFMGLLLYSPSSALFTVGYNFWCLLADMFLGSATAWLWYLIISEKQFNK